MPGAGVGAQGPNVYQVEHLETVQDILREVLLDDEIVITPETTAEDVEGWDSLAHVTIILKVEQAHGLRFKISDVAELANVGELLDLIKSETAKKA